MPRNVIWIEDDARYGRGVGMAHRPFCHLASKEQNAFVVRWCDADACLPADTTHWRDHEPFVGVSGLGGSILFALEPSLLQPASAGHDVICVNQMLKSLEFVYRNCRSMTAVLKLLRAVSKIMGLVDHFTGTGIHCPSRISRSFFLDFRIFTRLGSCAMFLESML